MKNIRKNLAVYLPQIESWAPSDFGQDEVETIARNVSELTGPTPAHLVLSFFPRALFEKAMNVPNGFSENGEQFLLNRMARLRSGRSDEHECRSNVCAKFLTEAANKFVKRAIS